MANRIVFKGYAEQPLDSISKYSARENKDLLFFDPDNITDFKSLIGKKDSSSYLFEFIQTMWGNDEIYEYILSSDIDIDLTLFGDIKEGTIQKLNIKYQYTQKKGLFSRYLYNVLFEYKNERYYLFVKTIAPRLPKILNTITSNYSL